MAVPKGTSGRDAGAEAVTVALTLCQRIGWVDADLLARWRWPAASHARKRAEALLRRCVGKSLLLPRAMPDRPAAYVLTSGGARRLGWGEPGTGWGRVRRGQPWRPPESFGHDWLAAAALVELHRRGGEVAFDREIRQANPAGVRKYPDGIAWRLRDGKRLEWWVEAEFGRKGGGDLGDMCREIADRYDSGGVRFALAGAQLSPRASIIVLPWAGHRDRRGYAIDHRHAIRARLSRYPTTRGTVPVTWMQATDARATGWEITQETIPTAR